MDNTISLPKKSAIYIRVSTHWQVDKDSLQVQKRELVVYSEMILNIPEYEIFEDPGYSAKNTDRPAYQQMMDRLRTGEFSHLLVWKIDRISRNLIDFANMYAELKSIGVTFVSKNEQFDTSSAIGEAMLKIILVFAELERKMTAERVSSVMLSRATNGQWNGGRVPYGYKWDKEAKEFSIEPKEARVYDRVLDMYEEHQSLLYVAKTLNGEGIKPRSGKDWTPTGIHKLLTNPFYAGKYLYNVHAEGDRYKKKDKSEWIVIEDHHVALVDEERYDRINLLLKRNRRGGQKPGESRPKTIVHIFAGILRCGVCGANMSATQDRRRADGWRPSIYGCSTRRKSATKCANKYISDITVGPFIFGLLSNILRYRQKIYPDMPDSDFQELILQGEPFAGIEMDRDSSAALKAMLLSGSTGMEYKLDSVFKEREDKYDERSALKERKAKDENALNRLKSLYLFGDAEMPEKDYVVERAKIMADLDKIDKRLGELSAKATESDDPKFIEKASYFLTVEYLVGEGKFNYEKYVRSVDPKLPQAFIRSVIDYAAVNDGTISSIVFKNGLTVRFIRK